MRRVYALAVAAILAASGLLSAQQDAEAQLVARAKAIHERVITLDTHDDINVANFTPECNYTQRLTTQVNIPKMKEGGLDVAFFIVYVGQGPLTPEGYANAYQQAVAKFDAIHRLTKEIAPDQIELALTPADVRRIVASGKKVAVIGVENGYPIGTDIKRVEEFYKRGGRYMSLAHNLHSQLADSNTGEANDDFIHKGLSDLGRQVIAEMNRLGMMVDISHPSKQANLQAMALSKAPVIASHSAARALGNHSRNLDDEQLMALKKNGGVVQTVAFANYINVTPPERAAETRRLNAEFGLTQGGGQRGGRGAGRGEGPAAPRPCPVEGAQEGGAALQGSRGAGTGGARGAGQGRGGGQNAALEALSPERRAEYDRRLAAINARYPVPPPATVKDFVNHIDYLVKKIGIDHVGISSDFDGG
ncbi:MAG: membrane dipeptidase, partial [Vicinamibacterales bacterium]